MQQHGVKYVFKTVNKGNALHNFDIQKVEAGVIPAGKSYTFSVVFKKAGKYQYLVTFRGTPNSACPVASRVKSATPTVLGCREATADDDPSAVALSPAGLGPAGARSS